MTSASARLDVGARLVDLALASGATSIAVVGTMKNAGKTVTFAAIVEALARRGRAFAAVSIGRDGEAIDAVTQTTKPRIRLPAGTAFATAVAALPAHPAVEIVRVTDERAAIGRVAIARTRVLTPVELAGPATASGMRRIVRELAADDRLVVLDGAIDRLSALRDGDDAIVVAVGAAGLRSMCEAVEAARSLVRRLQIPELEPEREARALEGALTPEVARELARGGERRAIVIDDPTRVALDGRALLGFLERHDLRVRRALHPIACTVAPSGPGASYPPAAFLAAVAAATDLPVYDVYAGAGREVAA